MRRLSIQIIELTRDLTNKIFHHLSSFISAMLGAAFLSSNAAGLLDEVRWFDLGCGKCTIPFFWFVCV